MGIEVWQTRRALVDGVDGFIEPTINIPVATQAIVVEEAIDKPGKPCPVCIEKNVVHFQSVVNGKKWYWLVSAFGYKGKFSLEDANGKLLQAMVSAVKGGELTKADFRVMDCSEVPDQGCAEWLSLQIHQRDPDVVIVMGLSLARLLLLSKDNNRDAAMKTFPVSMVCGEYDLLNKPLIATHHPAEIVADPSLKRQVWTDLQVAIARSND